MPKVKGIPSSKVMLSKKEAKQVRSLIKGQTKQYRRSIGVSGTGVNIRCLTSTGSGGFAGWSTGVLETSNDSCEIKHVVIRGYDEIAPLVTGAPMASKLNYAVRRLVVWYYKPPEPADVGGTLPVITACLNSSGIYPLPIIDAENAGRFSILSDKTWHLGCNMYNGTDLIQNGKARNDFEYKVIVNKTCHFKNPPANIAGTDYYAGHYDSTQDAGQLTRGVLMLYTIVEGTAGTYTANTDSVLTYVG